MQLVDTECQPPADRVDHLHNYRQRWKMRWVINQTLRNWNVQVALRALACEHGVACVSACMGAVVGSSDRAVAPPCASIRARKCACRRSASRAPATPPPAAAASPRTSLSAVASSSDSAAPARRPHHSARAPAQDPRPHAAPRCSRSLTATPLRLPLGL